MQSPRFRTLFPLLAVLLLAAPGCAQRGGALQTYPSAADLTVERHPVPTPDILTSDAAADAYDISIEAWGLRGWLTVGRLCIWAKERGMTDAPC